MCFFYIYISIYTQHYKTILGFWVFPTDLCRGSLGTHRPATSETMEVAGVEPKSGADQAERRSGNGHGRTLEETTGIGLVYQF